MGAEKAVNEAGLEEAAARPALRSAASGPCSEDPMEGALGQSMGLGLGTECWEENTLKRADRAWGGWPERINRPRREGAVT